MRNTHTPHYRWDAVLRLSEAATLCAAGDKVLEQQMADTLRRWPYYEYRGATLSLVSGQLKSKVCLAYVVEFLIEQGYTTPGYLPRLPAQALEALQTWVNDSRVEPEKSRPEPVEPPPEPLTKVEAVEVTVATEKPQTLAKVGDEWTEAEVQRCFSEYERLRLSGVKNYAAQTALLMGVSRQFMNDLFERFGVKKPKKRGTWDI